MDNKVMELFERMYAQQVEWVKEDMNRSDSYCYAAMLTKATATGMLLAAQTLGAIDRERAMNEMDNLKKIVFREDISDEQETTEQETTSYTAFETAQT